MIQIASAWFNARHVAAVSKITGGSEGDPAAFSVWVVGIPEAWLSTFDTLAEAEQARHALINAVTVSR